jgi:putative oligomerization/nucleic acid binding protein
MLLMGMMRASAMTGDPDYVNGWFAERQFGRWMMPAQPARRPPADPQAALRDLTELHQRGIVTDAEFERLRARVGR